MHCPPCHMSMSVTEFVDQRDEAALQWMKGWRCDRCGYEINPLAEMNRRFADPPAERLAPREPIQYWQDC